MLAAIKQMYCEITMNRAAEVGGVQKEGGRAVAPGVQLIYMRKCASNYY